MNTGDPDHLRDILSARMGDFDRDPYTAASFHGIAGGLVLMPNGPKWKEARETFEPAFKKDFLRKLSSAVEERTHRVEERLNAAAKSGEPIDIQAVIQNFTFDVVVHATFGVNLDSSELQKYEKAWPIVLKHLMWRFIVRIPYWKIFKTPGVREYEEKYAILKEFAMNQIKRAKDSDTMEPSCFLDFALKARKEGKFDVTDDELLVHMMTFLFAGHDTTMNLDTWIFYFLSQNAEIEKKLQEEVDSACSENRTSFEEIDRLEYLSKVIKETLRMKPSAAGLARHTACDTTLGRHSLAKGTKLIYLPYAAHMHPSLWKDPDVFDPERFTAEEVAKRHKFQYLPFGGGPRRCIGEKLALMETKILVFALVQKYFFRHLEGHKVEEYMTTTMRAKYGMMMHIHRRS